MAEVLIGLFIVALAGWGWVCNNITYHQRSRLLWENVSDDAWICAFSEVSYDQHFWWTYMGRNAQTHYPAPIGRGNAQNQASESPLQP